MTINHAPPPRTVIFTDGGCALKEAGLGAYAWLSIRPDGSVAEFVKAMTLTTNNRMEMRALLAALQAHPEGPLKVFSDSKYLIQGATEWSVGWQKYGWRTADSKPVKNRDLWEPILALLKGRDVRFEHLRGHAGHHGNERVDTLCTKAMQAARKSLMVGEPVEVDYFEGVSA